MAIMVNGNKFSYNCEEMIKKLQKDIENGTKYVTFVYYLKDNVEIPVSYRLTDTDEDIGDYESCQILAISLLQYLQTLNSNI